MSMQKRKALRHVGTAAVELAVCLPFLLIVILGIWEVGRMVQVQQLMANAAREGGREAAAGQVTAATVQQDVANYLIMNGLSNVTTSMVTVTNVTSGLDPTVANQLDQFQITVNVPYSSIRYSTLAQITSTTTLSATALWYSMRDSAITVDSTIPTN